MKTWELLLDYCDLKEGDKNKMETQICPVCTGSGIVDGSFYNRTSEIWTSAGGTEKCRSCYGKGYVIIPEEKRREIIPYWAEWKSKCCGAKMLKCRTFDRRFLFYRCTVCNEICELKEYR